MRKLLAFLLGAVALLPGMASGQVPIGTQIHTPTLEKNNIWSGTNTFSGTVTATEVVNGFYFCPIIDNTGLTGIDATAQACFNSAFANGETLRFGKGRFLFNIAQNWTNKPGFKVECAGSQFQLSSQSPIANAGETILLGNTGGVLLDTTGSGDSSIKNCTIFLAGTGITTPSTTGIQQGRDNAGGGGAGNPFCFQSKYVVDNVNIIDFTNNTTANGGRGYIGIANIGAENGIYRNLGIHTASPMVFGSTNFIPLTSPYQTLTTGCPAFMTEVSMDNLILDSFTAARPNIEASGTNSFHGKDMEFIGGNSAVLFEGATTGNWDISGAQESTIGTSYFIRSTVNVNDSRFHVEASGSDLAYINPEANNLSFTNNDFGFNTDLTIPLFTNTATGNSLRGGSAVFTSGASESNTTVTGTSITAPNITGAQLNAVFSSASSFPFTASDTTGRLGSNVVTFLRQLNNTTDLEIRNSAGTPLLFMTNGQNLFLRGDGSHGLILGSAGLAAVDDISGTITAPVFNPNSGKVLISGTAPTISSGFGTSPTISLNNGTASFNVNVGTGGTATNGVIGMPTAITGWNCSVNNGTASAGHRADNTVQTASTTSTVTIENQTKSTGAAVAWTASDIVRLNCFAN